MSKQAVVTIATSAHAELLDSTFATFLDNLGFEFHAFVIGGEIPSRRIPGVQYHLRKPDPSFRHPLREMYYRRFLFLDEIGTDYALLVDNSDVISMQALPTLESLLRGAAFGGCVEHQGSRYLRGQGYTSNYFNAGVTFWNISESRGMREEIVERGRKRFRSVEDQLTLNEVIQSKYFRNSIVLPCQFNFRAHFQFYKRGWPTVPSLDGVVIYHNSFCVAQAKAARANVRATAELPELAADGEKMSGAALFIRRLIHRFEQHKPR
jgi:hypothetical protein